MAKCLLLKKRQKMAYYGLQQNGRKWDTLWVAKNIYL